MSTERTGAARKVWIALASMTLLAIGLMDPTPFPTERHPLTSYRSVSADRPDPAFVGSQAGDGQAGAEEPADKNGRIALIDSWCLGCDEVYNDLFLWESDGSGSTPLTTATETGPDRGRFQPGAFRFWYSGLANVRNVATDGSGKSSPPAGEPPFFEGGDGVVVAPDGTRLAISSYKTGGRVHIVNVDGSGRRRLWGPLKRATVLVGDWTADGRDLVVVGNEEIWRVPLLGRPQRLTSMSKSPSGKEWGRFSIPRVAPDGSIIATFEAYDDRAAHLRGTYAIDPWSGEAEKTSVPLGAYSPDGTKVAHIKLDKEANTREFRITELDGSGSEVIKTWTGGDRYPRVLDWETLCTINGTDGDDILVGTSGDDVICGGGGADTIRASAGHDAIFGGSGTDTLFGGPGHDTLNGGAGDDIAEGGHGADILGDVRGSDHLRAGPGHDQLHVLDRSANDKVVPGDGRDVCFLNENDKGRCERNRF